VPLHYPTRHSVRYYGAVRLRDGKLFFRRETDKFNALTCWKFLQRRKAASTRTGRRVVVIIDNANARKGIRRMDQTQQHAAPTMRNYLRRNVYRSKIPMC
jgi:hypothetical protein